MYGVATYNPKSQPAPDQERRLAAGVRAQRAVGCAAVRGAAPGPLYGRTESGCGTWSGFRETTGDNIECIRADLKRGGYTLDTILGRIEKGKPVETGTDAIVGLAKKLTTGQYGVIYFLTHGAAPDTNAIKLEMGTLDDSQRKKMVGDRKIRHKEMVSLEDAIREQVLNERGPAARRRWNSPSARTWRSTAGSNSGSRPSSSACCERKRG